MQVLWSFALLLCLAIGLQAQTNPLAAIANHPRVKEAERLFDLGRKEVSAGQADAARDLFDRAIRHLLETPKEDPARATLDRYIQNLAEQIYLLDLESLGAARELDEVRFDKSPLDEIREMTFPIDPKLKSQVRQEVESTASGLPLVVNDTVLGYINYFANGKGRRTLEYALRRSGRYRPMIFRILAEEGVPPELIYLAQAESGFLPRAVSYKSAVGMWQFIRETGRTYGLTQTSFTDDRLDPERATRAAARHLRDLYNDLGDWHLALAAYNCGAGCVDRAVQRTAFADYWELRGRRAIPIETTNYVPIILALTIIMKNPADYGLADFEMEAPLEYDTIEVYSPTSLQLAADAAQIAVPAIEEMNPAILRKVVPAGYFLRVPKGSGAMVSERLNLVPSAKRESWRLFQIESGESKTALARRFGVTELALEEANPKLDETLLAGGFVVLPQAPAKAIRPVRSSAAVRKSSSRKASPRQSNARPAVKKPVAKKPVAKKPAAKKR